MKKHVVVQSYDKTWADDFVAIRDELNTVLSDLVLGIEHVGSTSVEGLSAKPIIDIELFSKVQMLLTRAGNGKIKTHNFLFSKLIRFKTTLPNHILPLY